MSAPLPPTAPPELRAPVSEAMRPGVVMGLPDATLPTLAAIMVTRAIHAVVVAPPSGGAPLIVTDLELVRAVVERSGDARIADVAREPAATLSATATLEDAVAMMAERYIAHLLVTDPGSGLPAGVVSSLDVVAVLGGWTPRQARVLRPGPARPAPSARTLGDASVADVMHPGIATCAPDAPLSAVALSMAEHRSHCIAVTGIDATGHAGQHLTWALIEAMDLVTAAHRRAFADPASTVAARAPLAVGEREPLRHAATLMVEHETAHVVVVGPSGLPSGMVSTLDVARIVAAGA